MMQKDDTAYLRHILDAISKIEEYVAGVDYESFTENTLVQDAVMRQLEIIGEAARRVRERTSSVLRMGNDGGGVTPWRG